ncbi:MAG: hypothetical protein FWG56_07595 [Desulfovibrionaceae bacterium]|nr:hypothetical protein [Desulfovibrionaceae bacterium]
MSRLACAEQEPADYWRLEKGANEAARQFDDFTPAAKTNDGKSVAAVARRAGFSRAGKRRHYFSIQFRAAADTDHPRNGS